MSFGAKYTGYFDSFSGMSQAARNYVHSLHVAGVPLTTENIPNLTAAHNLGDTHRTCHMLLGNDIDYKVKIIHLTPDIVTKYMEPCKYHIFHLFWETDRLPKWWVWSLNLVDEVWTGSEYSKKAFIDSGVKKPVFVFPQAVGQPPLHVSSLKIKNQPEFLFYSVFQWIERKDPRSLLMAYWKEFEGHEDVGLLIKTYLNLFTQEETAKILRQIDAWKRTLNQKHYPKVFLYDKEMEKNALWNLHATGNCFVSSHRGEGWSVCVAEALKMGKPVISTNLGGIHEFIPKGAALLAEYNTTKVFNMDFVPWYSQEQNWAQIKEDDLRKKMRAVYEHQEDAQKMGERGKKFADEKLSFMAVGSALKDRIAQIYEENNL